MVAHAHEHLTGAVEADRHGLSLLALAVAITVTFGALITAVVTAAGLH